MEPTSAFLGVPIKWSSTRVEEIKAKKRRKKATVLMRRHHHATFAHLIHDALLRLNCSPNIPHSGASKRAIYKNIERHYKTKLGRRFQQRLQLSLARLVHLGKLKPSGKTHARFKLSPAFLRQFGRLKVIDGAAKRRFGIEVSRSGSHRSRHSSHKSHSSHSHRRRKSIRSWFWGRGKRRSHSHSGHRSHSRSHRKRKKRRKKKRRTRKSRSRPHRSRSRSKSRGRSRSRGTHKSRSKSHGSKKRKSTSASSSHKEGEKKKSSWWPWPSKRSVGIHDAPGNGSARMERASPSSGRFRHGLGLGRMFKRFKRGRSRERASSRSHSRQSSRGPDRNAGLSSPRRQSSRVPDRNAGFSSPRRQSSRGPDRNAGFSSPRRQSSRGPDRNTGLASPRRQSSRGAADGKGVARSRSQSLGPPCKCNASSRPHYHGSSNPTVPYPSSRTTSKSKSKPKQITKVSSLIDNADYNMEDSERLEDAKDYDENAHGQTSSERRHPGTCCKHQGCPASAINPCSTSATNPRSSGRFISAPLTARLKSLLEE